jgi:predicted MFS family arabinose efflux permease
MLTLAAGAYLTGLLLDHGVAPRAVALGTGLVMLLPAVAWAFALRLWNEKSHQASAVSPQEKQAGADD